MARTRPNFKQLASIVSAANRYKKQINRLRASGQQLDCIEEAVAQAVTKLPRAKKGSLVIYGDPQSGKTEMMICLTAKLLDLRYRTIVHLMNDSVDLLKQNLERFKLARLAPSPRDVSDLAGAPLAPGQSTVLFCKKNKKDLTKLIESLSKAGRVVVVDDEADYATPNRRINKREKTIINALVEQLIGTEGTYIGVTATPARLNLNNTFDNRTETWVQFRTHRSYTGQDTFFPLGGKRPYRLELISGTGTSKDARRAFARFLVTVAHLNIAAGKAKKDEQPYTFLVHTSGKTDAHRSDRKIIEREVATLQSPNTASYRKLVTEVHAQAQELYPKDKADDLTAYVVENASLANVSVLNSTRGKLAGDRPTTPTSPFTVIIGGNIVSRGVTFPNLLAMYFTRDVSGRLQQDTYIQRARMFGARGEYLPHFELTIPKRLYADWHRCFVFHRLALQAIKQNDKASPVWLGDKRISVASASSIDRGSVNISKGEMSFAMFDCPPVAELDQLVAQDPTSIQTLAKLARRVGQAFPTFLVDYLRAMEKESPGSLAVHPASEVNYKDPIVVRTLSRQKGFIGASAEGKFSNRVHHVKIFYNRFGQARVFYKNKGGMQFLQNMKT